MLTYEFVYDITMNENLKDRKLDNVLLLVPTAIDEIVSKINKKGIKLDCSVLNKEVNFNNGYCILCEGKFIKKIIKENGTMIEDLPDNITSVDDCFHDDQLLVKVGKNMGFIDGLNGKLRVFLDPSIMAAQGFSEGYTIAYQNEDPDELLYYVNKELQMVSQRYDNASAFIAGRAVVATETEWQIVDREFKPLFTLPVTEECDDYFYNIIDEFDNIALKRRENKVAIVEKLSNSKEMIFLNSDTGFSIFMPIILADIAKQLGVTLPNLEIKEQLVWLINEASKNGVFAYDLEKKDLFSLKLRQGIRIGTDDGNLSVVSYDEKDVAFLRERVKKDKLND